MIPIELIEQARNEAIRIARLAGTKIKELRDKNDYQESLKFGYELLTTADLASNDIIKAEILQVFRDHRIISEEDIEQIDLSIEQPTWVIDPIDGTVGYANGHYQAAISIAFGFKNEVQVGVVYNPFLDEMFYACKGSGAFLNDKPIKVKEVQHLKDCVIATGFPHKKDDLSKIIAVFGNILPHIRDIRRMGSAALDACWVACGRLQGYYEGILHPWDIAAGKLIASEAGAKTGYYSPERDSSIPECLDGNNIIISSPGIFAEFHQILSSEE